MYGGSEFTMNDVASPQRSGGRKGLDEQTVIPVTIRMILNASIDNNVENGVMLRDGRSVHLVKFVGAVRSVEDLSTNVVFSIEDGTGLTEVKQWHDPSDCAGVTEMRMQASQENCYVRVIGQLKSYEGRIQIVGLSVRRVSTCNELTHHFLETVYSSEKSKRGAPQAQQQQYSMGTNAPFGNYGGSAPLQPRQQPLMAQSNMGNMGGVSDAARSILDYMKNPSNAGNQQGASKATVIKAMGGRFQESQMRQAFDELANNGMIYSTISDEYFQVC